MEGYERLLRTRLGLVDNPVFQWTTTYPAWRRTRVIPVFARIAALALTILVLFPIVILLLDGYRWYGAIYGAVALALIAAYTSAVRIVYHDHGVMHVAE